MSATTVVRRFAETAIAPKESGKTFDDRSEDVSQLGGQARDVMLLVMNELGAQSILSSKSKIGGDASAAAGLVRAGTIRPINLCTEELAARDIVLEGVVPVPPSAEKLLATLNQNSLKDLAKK